LRGPLDIYRSINPYSEAQFRTLKYRPDFPDRFTSLGEARAFCQQFFSWYNHDHRHSGIAWHTPHNVHYGHVEVVQAKRADVLAAAYARNPERVRAQAPRTSCPAHRRLDQQTGRAGPEHGGLRLKDSLRTLPQRS